MDDFGVGYSSIGYLQRFPVRLVKIDKSYVQTVEDPRTRKLVQGVVAMCHAMGLTVVAEGIESADSADMMRDLGCRVGQGFSLARPLPLAEAVALAGPRQRRRRRRHRRPRHLTAPPEAPGRRPPSSVDTMLPR